MPYPFGDVVPGCDAAFPLVELERRRRSLQVAMAQRGIDLLLATSPENIFYLCGQQTPCYQSFQCLCVPAEGESWLVVRGLEACGARANTHLTDIVHYDDADFITGGPVSVLMRELKARGLDQRRIASERTGFFLTAEDYGKLAAAYPTLCDASGLVEALRAIKSEAEIHQIEAAAKAAQAGMLAGIDAVRAGASENEIAACMQAAACLEGSEYPGMAPFVCTGYRSGIRHSTWRRRVLKEGDAVTLENAGCVNRYHAALFRTAYVGKCVDDRVRAMRDACVEGLRVALDTLKPGNRCADLHNAVQAVIDRHGYTDAYRKRSGYSIGIAFAPDWGEGHILSLYHSVVTELRAGMVFHIPIALCDYGRFMVATSETAIVTENGNRTLSSVPWALF